jgi:hypothetical protein
MENRDYIQGKVIGMNVIRYGERFISCWKNRMQAAMAPKPLDLEPFMGKIVEVSGRLHGDLWEASFERNILIESIQRVTGKVIGFNVIECPEGPVHCFRHGMTESWYMPLNLSEHWGETVTVSGELIANHLYRSSILKVPEPVIIKNPAKEARSLNDLLRIRAANQDRIKAVIGNLGTALGYKWTNNQKTDHPCVIVFVPQKTISWLIPEAEVAPEVLEAPDGTWCYTDVITGGKAGSLEDIIPLPPISDENRRVIFELRSGRVGLVGGVQLAYFSGGIEDDDHADVGTAGIAVRHAITGKIGFLTNQHVAGSPGRRLYHPWHLRFPIGTTFIAIEYATDENWYNEIIDESNACIRCDCGFVEIDDSLAQYVRSGLHVIGATGPLLRIDPETMDIIDQKVISVGRTRGVQRGRVAAYAYEYQDENTTVFTDLLILGEDQKAFSWKGDSGKIIVTDDQPHRPLALLWGGWQERLRHGKEQGNWAYAIDLGKVLDRLGLVLLE